MTDKDFSKLKRCACANFRATARSLTQYYDSVLQASGLRTTQFTLLANIATYGPLSVSELAEKLLMDQTTVTRNLKLLKEQELVESERGVDGRSRLMTVSGKGVELLEKVLPHWEQAQAQIVSGLGEERFRALLKELAAVNALTR